MVRKIAITGNIASGKSEVQKILKNKGFKVFDADVIAHEILEREMPGISREVLSKIAFTNPQFRKKLEELIHPGVKEQILRLSPQDDVVFIEVPLLFEANMQDMFDKVVLVYADDEIRLERLLKRSGCTKEHALARMNSQMPQDEKIKLSDFVIYNNGALEDLTLPDEF